MASLSNTDIMFEKLKAIYPALPEVMSTLQEEFESDNPTWSRANMNMRRDFYIAEGASGSSVADLERDYWTDLVP